MPQVTVVSDSASCLTRELIDEYGINIIPLNILFGGKVYLDLVDITTGQAYELFLKDPALFKTSPPSPESCFESFRALSRRTTNILCITISRKISTFYNVALIARERAKSELHGVLIEVMDSETATATQGFIAMAAARAAAAGKNLNQVVQAAEEMKSKLGMIVLLDTMRHVYRSGRIPKIAAQTASVLNIRPLLTISSGMVKFIGATRSRNHGIDRLIHTMRNKVKQNPVHVAVMHAYALDEAMKLKERVASEFNCAELWISEFSPLMGYACGTGTLGLAFYPGD